MRLKTSCFNGTLAKNSLRRFWPLPVGVLVYYLLTLVMSFYQVMSRAVSQTLPMAEPIQDGYVPSAEEQIILAGKEFIYGCTQVVFVPLVAFALVAAMLVLHHLHTRKEIQFYHGLPLKRRCLYLTSVLMGYLMVAVPMLLAELITMGISVGMGGAAFPVLALMGMSLGAFTILYALAVLACVLAGQTFGAFLLYAGMNCAALIILGGAYSVAQCFIPGLTDGFMLQQVANWLTPVLRIFTASCCAYSDNGQITGYSAPWAVGIYAGVGILLLILGGVLYQKRPGETAGEMVSFQVIRLLSKILGALTVAMAGICIILSLITLETDLTFLPLLLMVLVLTLVGWIAAEMVIQKSFRVFQRRTMGQCGVLLVLVLLLMVGGKADVLGYVRRTPDLSRVESASLSWNGAYASIAPTDALRLHETILNNLQETSNNTSMQGCESMQISYTYGDGSCLNRSYYIHTPEQEDGAVTALAREILMKPENNYQTWFPNWQDDLTEETAISCNLSIHGMYSDSGEEILYLNGGDRGYMEFTPAEAVTLYHAVLQDMAQGNIPPNGIYSLVSQTYYGELDFTRYVEAYSAKYGTYANYRSTADQQYAYVDVTDRTVCTLDALAELGITVNGQAK